MRDVALVTGGCRRLGAVIAARLARAGYDLVLQGVRDGEPDPALRAVLEEHSTDWTGLVADFTQPSCVEPFYQRALDAMGRAPALLVNGASRFGSDRLGDATADALMTGYAVDAAAPALLIQALARSVGPEGAAVVNLLDQRLVQPHGDQLSYTMAKYALSGLTQIAARVLAPAIRVNAVAPGLSLPSAAYAPGQAEAISAHLPLQRMVRPDDVADAVLYLAKADRVTGQTIFVDAGARLVSFDRDFTSIAIP